MRSLAHVRGLLHVAHFHQAPGRHPVPRHIPEWAECIELVTGGVGAIEDAGDWRPIGPGDLIWQCAGDLTIGRSDFTNPYRCLAVNVLVEPGSARPAPRVTRWEDLDEVRWFTRQAVRWADDETFDRDALVAWIYGRLLVQARLWERRSEDDLPASLRRVLDVLDGRFAEDLSLEDLAEAAGWSVTHLHAEFRRHLGTTPHRYLVERRLRAARHLLLARDQTVADVAAACGFSSAAVFCRVFRSHVGKTPGGWRRRQTVGVGPDDRGIDRIREQTA